MKKCTLLLFAAVIPFLLPAQAIFFVSPGTSLFVKPTTFFYAGGLTLVPSAAFTLNDVTFTRNPSVIHLSSNPSILRAYSFNNVTPVYAGIVQMEYLTSELNGLAEPLLRPNIHNGTGWQSFGAALNDVVNHLVVSAAFSGTTLSEVTLASVSAPLPLEWGKLNAKRNGEVNEISWTTYQESGISHFDIEYSLDAKRWQVAVSAVAAANLPSGRQYRVTDPAYKPGYLLYRISETDLDGRITHSAAIPIAAVNEASVFTVYPNPATDRFYISWPQQDAIAETNLYATNGTLVKHWSDGQAVYRIPALAPGVYIVSIKSRSGLPQSSRLVVR